MKKVLINAKEMVRDIKSGKSDYELRTIYGISDKSLLKVKAELLARKLIDPEQHIESPKPPPVGKRRIEAESFLGDFRARPDDLYLMEKYCLKPAQLKKVYTALVAKGLLSEFELDTRDGKFPGMDEEAFGPAPASTVVSVVERGMFGLDAKRTDSEAHDLPSEFFKDHSGIKIGRPGPPEAQDAGTAEEPDRQSAAALRTLSTVVEIIEGEYCPRCGSPKTRHSVDSCLHCGIVFAKFKAHGRQVKIPVWGKDIPHD